jgi:cytochrome c oxidase assembly factor CtaG
LSFVDWASGLVLLLVAVAGLYGAAQAFLRRTSAYDASPLSTRGAVLLGLLYLAGGLVSGGILILLLSAKL